MTDTRPGIGLTVGQLLDALQESFASVTQNKPVDLTLDEAQTYEQRISDILLRARCLINSFRASIRTPPEVLGMLSSHLTEEDLFSASQVCHYWRSALTSSPTLWTQVSCDRVRRAIVSLDRCGSLPIRLQFKPPFSHVAQQNMVLEDVLLRKSKIVSLTVNHRPNIIPQLHQLLMHSRPSVEQLYIHAEDFRGWRAEERTIQEIWQDLPSVRELFVFQYYVPIEKLKAPNLVHLALEITGNEPNSTTTQSILDMLRGCPLLETFLLDHHDPLLSDGGGHPSVCLPRLRSIEVGVFEANLGLVPYLDFPRNVAVGLRRIGFSDLRSVISNPVVTTTQHVLGKIDIHSITLAAPITRDFGVFTDILVRFEGLQGSLEMTAKGPRNRYTEQYAAWDISFGPDGVLFSHPHNIRNVTELHVIGHRFRDDQAGSLHHVSTVIPNVVSISFFHCDVVCLRELLAPTSLSTPLFPHLERVMVLGHEPGLEEIVRGRKDLGVPLKTLVVGRGPEDFEYDHLEDYTTLEGLVDDLRVGCPTEILEWGTGNEIRNFWPTIEDPLHTLNGPYGVFKFCRFNVPGS